jgi:predicted RNase H-like nuclease
MTTLLVGFDSAWTPTNAGAIVGVIRRFDGTYRELGFPEPVAFGDAERAVLRWQAEESPEATIVLLDQPTIVRNSAGQRPVENIVASPVSLRFGGVQPANTSRGEMFGGDAPVWGFLSRFGGVPDPFESGGGTRVFETYPVLAMIALGWTLPHGRATGRLPKYNPERRKTFLHSDWQHVCALLAGALNAHGLMKLAGWCVAAGGNPNPRKRDQDGVDACLCLLVALHLKEQRDCLMVGNTDSGYIVVPYGPALNAELNARCVSTGRLPSDWVRSFRLVSPA